MTRIVAALGPTNTGKTHHALETLLAHETGMIGLPLRLLARECYDRLSARVGEGAVALVTGEEKRVPPRPRYWVCTVEAMPVSRDVEVVAIDEIQLASHPERGHVFTDRLLHARGTRETLLLGSHAMTHAVRELLPHAEHVTRPRLSSLSFAGSHTLARLPKRSALVSFSQDHVYELAERVREKHGGAAVVLGALSPRTRNAQVALYQSGQVDHLVATDAIGMGLNLDVEHVAFARLGKFDGREARALDTGEIAQIAGRAGRHTRDGTFGTLAPLTLAEPLARRIEAHAVEPVERLYYRVRELDLSSVAALRASLREAPRKARLRLVPTPTDELALAALAARPEVAALARGEERVALLWQVAQVPDYEKLLFEKHVGLLAEVYRRLASPPHRLPASWVSRELEPLAEPAFDVETLLARLAAVRTWTYITTRPGWVEDGETLAEAARVLEDRTSDALHERLVERFVERKKRTSVPRPGPRALDPSSSGAAPGSAGRAEGSRGRRGAASGSGRTVRGLERLAELELDLSPEPGGAPALEVETLAERLADAPIDALSLDVEGALRFEGKVVGRLEAGRSLLEPAAKVTLELEPGPRLRVARRLSALARDGLAAVLEPLRVLSASARSAPARGLAYQLERGLGTVLVAEAREQLGLLSHDERRALLASGVVVGRVAMYHLALYEPSALALRGLLVALAEGRPPRARPDLRFVRPRERGQAEQASVAEGYVPAGRLEVAAPVLERALASARAPSPRAVARELDVSVRDALVVLSALEAAGHALA